MLELNSILRYKEMFWKQKSKFRWIKEGDGHTSFFHRVVNGRKRKNVISKLTMGGVEVTNFEDIAHVANDFFVDLYTRELVLRPRIDNLFSNALPIELAEALVSPFTEDEIRLAIFSMDKDKSLVLMDSLWDFTKFVGIS